ncbi:MAG: ATP-dependent DNA helicase UvrD2 [Actinomycetota bacterium]|nr:ATP-dependent DNA helicase UvrD2 [Actinomycetota bacterium]
MPASPAEATDARVSRVVDGLTAAQRRAVTTEANPVCVLAGAGSGKTRVLTRRIAYRLTTGTADPGHVLALTFTRKAAGELGQRLAALGLRDRVVTGTFHAVAIAALRQYWADCGRRPPALLERKARVLAPLVAARPALAGVPLAELAGQLEWAQARLVDPDDLEGALAAASRRTPVAASELAALFRRYESEKQRRGLIDFDDVLARASVAMESDAAFATAQRWRWRHLFVDEFQDLNPAQHRLLAAWSGTSADLCVVGDPNQAIYGWNGADASRLVDFATRWPGAEVIRLEDNHRCSPQIVHAAASVLGMHGAGLRSTRPDGAEPDVVGYASDDDEARGVAAAVGAERADGVPWSQMGVLARTNAQVRALAAALDAAGVPHRVPGSADLLTHPVTVRALDALHRQPARPARMATADLVEAASVAGRDTDRDVLEALVALARQYERVEAGARGAGLADWLVATLARDRDGATAPDGVTVCSFHRAKGLEWSTVWICGLEAGLVPIGHAGTAEAVDEERRLLYVAMTRASSRLHASWARRRRFAAHPVPREPSPWLSLIDRSLPVDVGPPLLDAAAWRARLDEQRRALRVPSGHPGRGRRGGRRGDASVALHPADPRVVTALQTWRAEAARASGVPAHVLLHDRTLDALASLAPTTLDGLADIPGLGPVKVARYGPTLLGVVQDHRDAPGPDAGVASCGEPGEGSHVSPHGPGEHAASA